jgi:hypothetical protein
MFVQNCVARLQILHEHKKRNNIIDILKAGGTRILLFLLFNDILVEAKNQAKIWPMCGLICLPLGLRATLKLRVVEGAGLPLSTLRLTKEL